LAPIAVSEFDRRLRQIQEDYPPEAWYAMMNLVGSHDTNRVRFVLGKWQKGYDDSDPLAYDLATDLTPGETDRRQQLMALLQFTLPGAPTIYYGDEVGIDAPGSWHNEKWEDDPYNRVPFPWDDTPGHYAAREDVRATYALLARIRGDHPALRTGTHDTLLTDDANGVYVFGRDLAGTETVVVVVNRSAVTQAVNMPLSGYVADGTALVDCLGGGLYTVAGGSISLQVPPEWGAILAPAQRIYLPVVVRSAP